MSKEEFREMINFCEESSMLSVLYQLYLLILQNKQEQK